jgi:hypothetical protein
MVHGGSSRRFLTMVHAWFVPWLAANAHADW